MFIAKVERAETRQIIDRYTTEQSTPQFNNTKSIKKKSKLHIKILFKDIVAIPCHSLFRILSHKITPDSTPNGSNSND